MPPIVTFINTGITIPYAQNGALPEGVLVGISDTNCTGVDTVLGVGMSLQFVPTSKNQSACVVSKEGSILLSWSCDGSSNASGTQGSDGYVIGECSTDAANNYIIPVNFYPSCPTYPSGNEQCGEVCYNTSAYACLNGKIYEKDMVCNGVLFNTSAQICIDGVLCSIGDQLCGTTCIDPSDFSCIDNVPCAVENVCGNQCCKPGVSFCSNGPSSDIINACCPIKKNCGYTNMCCWGGCESEPNGSCTFQK